MGTSVKPIIIRTLALPAQELFRGGHFVRCLRELERQQWLPPEQIQNLQFRKLQRLLDHCARNVPYYQRLFRAHDFDPARVRSLEDLAQLPPLTKVDLQAHKRDLMAVNMPPQEFLPNRSGGSSGEVTQFFLDRRCLDYARAAQYRYYYWLGFRFGDRQALVWGSPTDLSQTRRVVRRVRSYLLNKMWLDANQLTDASIDAYLSELIRFQPRLVVGYATGLWCLAEYLLVRGLRLASLLGVVSTAEVLPEPKRDVIEKGFGVKVYDRYGCGEMKDIAQQCGHSPHSHVNADNVLVEFLQDDRPVPCGIVGEVVATNLNNYAMPLLRYRLGDLGHAVEEQCPCGRGLPLMSVLSGRIYEVLTLPNGGKVHAALLNHIMYGLPGVRQYQIVQETLARLVCRIIRGPEFSIDTPARIQSEISRYLGAEVHVDFEFPERIMPSPSGKHQFIYSKLKPFKPALESVRRVDAADPPDGFPQRGSAG